MTFNNQPPPPPGYPQQPQQFAPQQQPAQQGGYQSNEQYIGGWHAAQSGMETGKHIEYKVTQRASAKGLFKQVTFFKPYKKKDGTPGEGFGFALNKMKELVDRINHFMNMFGEEKGYFVWQPMGAGYGQGQPASPQAPQYPQQQPQYGAPQQFAPPPPAQPQYQQPMPQQGYGAPPAPQYGAPPVYHAPAAYAPPQGHQEQQQPAQQPPPPPTGQQWP